MAKSLSVFRCSQCGWQTSRWQGQCDECAQWGTLVEAPPLLLGQVAAPGTSAAGPNSEGGVHKIQPLAPATAATAIKNVSAYTAKARPTGIGELDRVLGGGIVPGAVVLLAGEPGVGKSTLLLEVAAGAAREKTFSQAPVLYVSGEESASQVRLRADRIGALADNLYLAAETRIDAVLGQVAAVNPSLLVLDSVQTIYDPTATGSAGGNTQVRSVTATIVHIAKELNLPVILVGHVTKDGTVAGPRVLEHLVDVVCQFEGDKNSRLRLLRAIKNRFGPTDEVGCFDMDETGIVELQDPSGIFLAGSGGQVPGTCVTICLDGRRALPTQVQALVADSALPSPRRSSAGLDTARTNMTLAVLQARLGMRLAQQDVYVATVGGAKVTEPAVDLAVALAVISAARALPIPAGTVALGEIGLTGQLQRTSGVARRLQEAQRLGFSRALVPAGLADKLPAGLSLEIVSVSTVSEAVRTLWPA